MKKLKISKIFHLFLPVCFCFVCGKCQTEQKEYSTEQKKYSFVQDSLNVIHNAEELNGFFSVLKSGKKQINILHIGDSHLQQSPVSVVLRSEFQKLFGNAGRGLIVPYHVAGTGSPHDIFSSSANKWEGKRNCKPLLPQANGIGGITIESKDSVSAFIIELTEDYAFTKMTVFFENDGKSHDLQAKDLLTGQIVSLKDNLSKSDSNVAVIQFQKPTTKVEISGKKTEPNQTHTTIFGINTENEQKGLIYHSIGVNGSEYFHYDTSKYFNEETPFLNPDLIIISLGTNEAFRNNIDFDEKRIKKEVGSFITHLKEYNPVVPFLITTPANVYKDKVENPRIKTVRDILISYCKENHIAYWDLQEITGKAENWKNNDLLNKDLIHFNDYGYQLQGNLLFNAIMNSYKEYTATH
ncbi:MAG: GDSL-type esterase/lipase family protein [Flavobacteriaceae bacterium]|jgi:hypothetical protein|nr:GDSL-type esterase/lipase family protein [Flavobacteriaceae bacterium]